MNDRQVSTSESDPANGLLLAAADQLLTLQAVHRLPESSRST